jgi:xanthine dehydrogenase small subunit
MLAQPGPRLPLAGLAKKLGELAQDQPLSWPGRFHAPHTMEALAALRLSRPQARLLAGGTDVGLWVTKQLKDLGEVIALGDVAELRALHETELDGSGAPALHIGAALPLEDAWAALVRRWPALAEMHRRFAGPLVRHAGTLVGNLANGSPIGDGAPVLIALGARLRLRCGEQTRHLALEDFYLGYMKNVLAPGEFIEAVQVPLETSQPGSGWVVQAHKISKRSDCDISAVAAGFALQLDGAGRVAQARLAWGGMAAMVQRAAGAEAAIIGQPWGDETTLRAAQAALQSDFVPLTDLRASASYRRRVAAALLERLWLSSRPGSPVALSQLRATPHALLHNPALLATPGEAA